MARFYDLCSDVNWREYGGKWYSRQPYYGGVEYYVVELINWQDATGDDMTLTGREQSDYPNMYMGDRHETKPGKARYAVETTHFDTAWYDKAEIDRAIDSGIGHGALNAITSPRRKAIMVMEACTQYGLGDVSDITYGNNAYQMLRAAKRRVS